MRSYFVHLPCLVFLASTLALSGEIQLKQEGNSLILSRNGQLVTQYRSDTHVPCLYPIIGPTGTSLTRHFPLEKNFKNEEKDHPHHISFWFTHGSINGLDFWTDKNDPDCRIKHLSFGEMKTTTEKAGGIARDHASFIVNLAWQQKNKVLLTETRLYSFTITDEALSIEVQSTISAPHEDIIFGDTKEGSFALRLTPSLRVKGKVAKGHALNSEGDKDEKIWGKRASWVAYYGPDSEGKEVTVAMFDHPKNLRYPTWWHARDYGLVAANPFGQHDFENHKDAKIGDFLLKKGDDFTQNYRVLFQKGKMNPEELERVFQSASTKRDS